MIRVIFCFLFSFPLFVKAADTLSFSTEIRKVQVYFSGAEISRSGSKYLNKGKYTLVLEGLPYGIDQQGLRASEPDGLRLLGIKPESKDGQSYRKSKAVLRLEDSIEATEYALKALAYQENALTQERKLLLDNAKFYSEQSGAALTTIQEAATYYRQQLNNINQRSIELDQEKDRLMDRMEGQNQRMQALVAALKKPSSTVVLDVECTRSGTFALEISYFLDHAGWEPGYDFRLPEFGEALDIVYTAQVYQSTGENWDKVEMSLQAGYPNLSQEAPEIKTWYAGQEPPRPVEGTSESSAHLEVLVMDKESQPLEMATIELKRGAELVQATTTNREGKARISGLSPSSYSLVVKSNGFYERSATVYLRAGTTERKSFVLSPVIEKVETVGGVFAGSDQGINRDVEMSRTTITREDILKLPSRSPKGKSSTYYVSILSGSAQTSLAITYTLDQKVSLPSNGNPQAMVLKETSQPVHLVYLAAPHLSSEAFLLAELTQWSNLDLLPGKARLFYQGNYRGETSLNPEETGDTLRLSMGRDPSLVLKRQIDKTVDEKRFLSGEVRETLGWFLEVRNNKGRDVKVRLVDQFPISQNDALKVDLKEHKGAEINHRLGTLTWEFLLPPGTTEKKYWKYEFRYPK